LLRLLIDMGTSDDILLEEDAERFPQEDGKAF
jgi:hypothetical protein